MYCQVQMPSSGFICSFVGKKQQVTDTADRMEFSVSPAGGACFWNAWNLEEFLSNGKTRYR